MPGNKETEIPIYLLGNMSLGVLSFEAYEILAGGGDRKESDMIWPTHSMYAGKFWENFQQRGDSYQHETRVICQIKADFHNFHISDFHVQFAPVTPPYPVSLSCTHGPVSLHHIIHKSKVSLPIGTKESDMFIWYRIAKFLAISTSHLYLPYLAAKC